MKLEQRHIEGVTVLAIDGDITMSDDGAIRLSDRVRSELQQGHDRIVLDLGHVRYVDSAGLGELVQSLSAVRNRGGAMKLVNVSRRLNDLLVMTRLLTVFECFDRESDALASFGPIPGVV